MERLTATPFGSGAMTFDLIEMVSQCDDTSVGADVDKWAISRDLTQARVAFGVTDRDLVVLAALLSFYPEKMLRAGQGIIVFPSNVSLSERTHGMAESTLRRHLAALCKAGLILRHDSPNGKRYAAKDRAGQGRWCGLSGLI